MLSDSQALDIVRDSLRKVSGPANQNADQVINDQQKREDLIVTIAADASVGVPRFQHNLNANNLIDEFTRMGGNISEADLASAIQRLAAGKLCSNPVNPHPQKCCPYPKTCPQCGYTVF